LISRSSARSTDLGLGERALAPVPHFSMAV
jgi:hypothetical protein